jgi:two-component system sensor histidine kinase MprB
MTFRMRLTLLTSLAVAVALIGVSLVVYYSYRQDLLHQADGELAASLTTSPVQEYLNNLGAGISPESSVLVLPGSATALKVTVLHGTTISPPYVEAVGEFHYVTTDIDGVPTRQLTILGSDTTVTVTRSLLDVDRSLSRLRWLLALACGGGVGLAVLFGALVSRRAIAPLRRLTETTERIAETGRLDQRTGQRGRDEISRLSTQLDALLTTLEHSLRSQRQLVADASHELRTPIATLRANVGVLAQRDELDESERAELVADIQEELESMTALVGELVELAHGEELDVAPVEFRLDDLVQTSVDRAARRSSAVTFRTTLDPTTVVGFPERVERAVDNLLDNARKWSPSGATIDVSVRDGSVEVRDHGPGISPEDLPLVFNRFYRSAKARGMPGAGLGLAIVKQVADAHNGTVTAGSAPGGGAVLRLALGT